MQRLSALMVVAVALWAEAATAHPVLMISIDGLRPLDVIEAPQRGMDLPNLRTFMTEGTYAHGVDNVLPTVTYPNHTTLITGVKPAVHGIYGNVVYDPLQKNMGGWYWYARDIKVPTLWDAVHEKGGVVASIGWPVSVGARSIDDNIPEYWRAATPDDAKLIRALSTPRLFGELEAKSGVPVTGVMGTEPKNDVAKGAEAAALIELKHPEFMTLHLSSLDHIQHLHGPGTPKAKATLTMLDGVVGKLIAAARKAEPDLVVAIVSDHGFLPVSKSVNLGTEFVKAGLITLGANGKPASWKAEPWTMGGSSAVVLADPTDQAVKTRVATLLKRLAADPKNGIARIIDKSGIAARGAAPTASFWIDFREGYLAGNKLTGPMITKSGSKGTHGYFPSHPELHSTFMIDGPGVPKKGDIGEIDMRDIAPTVAKVMDVSFPSAQGTPVF